MAGYTYGTKNRSDHARLIETRLVELGKNKQEVIDRMADKLGQKATSARTFHRRVQDGNWTESQARFLARELKLPLARLLPDMDDSDDLLVAEAFQAFMAALIELDIDRDLPPEKATAMFMSWVADCREAGVVDKAVLIRRIEAYL